MKRKARALTRDTRQTGSSDLVRDRQRRALAPGKRRSKNGTIYYENRKNRSDVKGRDTPLRLKKRVKRSVKANSSMGDKVLRSTLRKSVIIGAFPRTKKLMIQDVTHSRMREPLRGARRHDLLPLSLRRKLPKIYSQEKTRDPMVYAKFFSPYNGYTLYITEFDGKDRLFGFVTGGNFVPEWGYASFNELVRLNRGGLPLIERDMYFSPKRASKIKEIKLIKRR